MTGGGETTAVARVKPSPAKSKLLRAKMLMDEGLLVSKRPERAEKVKDVPPEELFSICGPCMSWVGLDHWVRMMSMRVSRMLPKSFPDKPIVKGGAALVAKST